MDGCCLSNHARKSGKSMLLPLFLPTPTTTITTVNNNEWRHYCDENDAYKIKVKQPFGLTNSKELIIIIEIWVWVWIIISAWQSSVLLLHKYEHWQFACFLLFMIALFFQGKCKVKNNDKSPQRQQRTIKMYFMDDVCHHRWSHHHHLHHHKHWDWD